MDVLESGHRVAVKQRVQLRVMRQSPGHREQDEIVDRHLPQSELLGAVLEPLAVGQQRARVR